MKAARSLHCPLQQNCCQAEIQSCSCRSASASGLRSQCALLSRHQQVKPGFSSDYFEVILNISWFLLRNAGHVTALCRPRCATVGFSALKAEQTETLDLKQLLEV